MEEDALEALAVEEILKDLKRGAERAKEHGALGWQKNPAPPPNKRFLRNMLVSTLRDDRPLNYKRKFQDNRSQQGSSQGYQNKSPRRDSDAFFRYNDRYNQKHRQDSKEDVPESYAEKHPYREGHESNNVDTDISFSKSYHKSRYSNKRPRESSTELEEDRRNGEIRDSKRNEGSITKEQKRKKAMKQ